MWVESIRDLSREEYELIRELVYAQSGINLGDKKMQLVRARLGKRLRTLKMSNYRDYYEYVKADKTGQELTSLIDAISTNTTHLFRENQHFQFLETMVKQWMQGSGSQRRSNLRIWSAGCSSGDEPYSIVMTMDNLARQLPGLQYKILATDISTRMLERASQGIFGADRLATVSSEFKQRYFQKVKQDGDTMMQILPELRKQITFKRLNLMDDRFPFRNGFDVIFCRNVMIYFDRPTQETLVGKYTNALLPGGHLLIGHSESLNNIKHSLVYVMPTVYRKP